MKKVAVITMHRIYNYGSVLQTYATQKVFEKERAKCEIIDYISPYRTKRLMFWDYPPKLKGKKIRRILYYAGKIFSFILKDFTFGSFIKKNLSLSQNQYVTNKDLLDNPPEADVYVTGSDQVWNSIYNHGIDESYYLNFAAKNARKAAYAASFGVTELNKEEQHTIRPLLSEYFILSVRENSAVSILKNMGFESVCLIDPTLQLCKEDWLTISSKRLVKSRYLLLFLLYNEDNGASLYAKYVAEKKGLKIVKLSWELKKPKDVDILFTHRKPQDFLSLVAYADFIVTNSFHGVAFSINLNRQFIFIPRSELNGRIESLLKLTGLENRMIQKENNLYVIEKNIDYTLVNSKLNEERKKTRNYIQKILV